MNGEYDFSHKGFEVELFEAKPGNMAGSVGWVAQFFNRTTGQRGSVNMPRKREAADAARNAIDAMAATSKETGK